MDIFFVCDHDREIPSTIFHSPNEIVYVELCKLNILSVIFLSQIIRQKRKKTSRTQDYPDTFFNTISLAPNILKYILSPCCSTSTGPSNKLKANTYLFTHSEKYNTVPIGFSDHPPSEGSRSLNPARPLKPESGYSNQVVLKSRVWV